MIKLITGDGQQIVVKRKVAFCSRLIYNVVGDLEIDEHTPIPLEYVNGHVLMKALEWCEQHQDDPQPEENAMEFAEGPFNYQPTRWDMTFIPTHDQKMLFDIIMAANYMDIQGLLDLSCYAAAEMIRGKSAEEICALYNITCDWSPQELQAIHEENDWAQYAEE